MLIKDQHCGHTALWLENQILRIGVLPGKGADIFEITYRPDGIQILMETPAGLKPFQDKPPAEFLDNYEGGWQELFPNHGDACLFRGQPIPMHGEVALYPWEVQVLQDDAQATAIHLQVQCKKTPFLLERIMRLRAGEASLEIQSKVTNLSDQPCEFVWGHHITLGEAFLNGESRLDIPAATVHTPDVIFEPRTARLAPGQTSHWPKAQGRKGEPIDLRLIPGKQTHSHDDAYLTGFKRGRYTVVSPHRKLSFSLDWDEKLFPWIVLWQPYGGADLPPLTGTYGVGIEPWVSYCSLAEAIEQGEARILAGRESLETRLTVSVTRL